MSAGSSGGLAGVPSHYRGAQVSKMDTSCYIKAAYGNTKIALCRLPTGPQSRSGERFGSWAKISAIRGGGAGYLPRLWPSAPLPVAPAFTGWSRVTRP